MRIRSVAGQGINSSGTNTVRMNQFRGVDMTSGAANVDLSRSPDAPNMMPDINGYPVKRNGFELKHVMYNTNDGASTSQPRINAAYKLTKTYKYTSYNENNAHVEIKSADIWFYHATNKLYMKTRDGVRLVSGAGTPSLRNYYSTAVELNGKLWIVDGKGYYYIDIPTQDVDEHVPSTMNRWDGEYPGTGLQVTFGHVKNIAKIPTVAIGREPAKDGPGTSYEPVNILSNQQIELFGGDGKTKSFSVSLRNVDPYIDDQGREYEIAPASYGEPIVKVKENGAWRTLARGTSAQVSSGDKDYWFSALNGTFTFKTAPASIWTENSDGTAVRGEDNVSIQYTVLRDSLLSKIYQNQFCVLYGVGGAMDRIFMAGDPEHPNVDRWSDFNDPTFMPDINYSTLGKESSPIMGYSILNNHLVTHKRDEENERNAWVRYGELDDKGDAIFRITNVIQGEGPITNKGYCSMGSEPIFVAQRGVYALTPSDLTGERYNQKRSYYIETEFLKEVGKLCTGCLWGRFYVLSTGKSLYLLDMEHKSFDNRDTKSSYQYDCYYFPNIPARCVWAEGDLLCIGMNRFPAIFVLDVNNKWSYRHYEPDYDFIKESYDKGVKIENLDRSGHDGSAHLLKAKWSSPVLTLGSIANKKTITDAFVMTPAESGEMFIKMDVITDRVKRTINEYKVRNNYLTNIYEHTFTTRLGQKIPGANAVQIVVTANDDRRIDTHWAFPSDFGVLAMELHYKTANKTIKEEYRARGW